MSTPILRATFGRLALAVSTALGRSTIGHIDLAATVLTSWRDGHTGGHAGKNKVHDPELGVKFIPFTDRYRKQRIREDVELLELVLAMIEGKMI